MDQHESADIIRAEGLRKTFGKLVAVDDLSIAVRKGEIYGFLGPNGAGKTTTVRMITTMERPDAGKVFIEGFDTSTDYIDARKNIGVIQQQNSLDKDISVRENIMHHALMQNLSFKESKKRMYELCEIMELTDRLDSLVSTLSGGWKKRVSIVCSLIHHPDILFMDEPTTGLDTQSRNMLWKMIRNINRSGTTIFLTTHYIFEADSLCDRVGIINKGHMVAEGTPKELKDRLGRIALVYSNDDNDENIRYFSDRNEAKIASLELPHDYNVTIRATNLEDVFLELTGRKL